ncbi:hypothetical protein ACJ41O_012706 [Fusarium nematophilum]
MPSSRRVRIAVGAPKNDPLVQLYETNYPLIYEDLSIYIRSNLHKQPPGPKDIPKPNLAINKIEDIVEEWEDVHFANLALWGCQAFKAASLELGISPGSELRSFIKAQERQLNDLALGRHDKQEEVMKLLEEDKGWIRPLLELLVAVWKDKDRG